MTNTDMSKDSDSGQIITSSDILLHDAKTALLYEELRAAIDDGHESMTHADALAEIAAIRAENEKLHAELASIGAGGVNGPLMGQRQAMPDLSALTERGAVAWAGVDALSMPITHWMPIPTPPTSAEGVEHVWPSRTTHWRRYRVAGLLACRRSDCQHSNFQRMETMGMNPTPPGQVPEALHLADQYAAAHAKWELEDLYGSSKSYTAEKLAERHAARANLERALHAAHVQNPAEIEHVAGDVSKNGVETNMSTQQPAPAGAMATWAAVQEHYETLADFQEGQWWVNELDAMASHPIGQTIRVTPDMLRAVAVVHNLLRAAATPQPAPATPITVEQVEDAIGLRSSAWDTIGAEKIVEAVLRLANAAPATQQAGEVSDAMVLAALRVQYPAAYGQYLRHPANGPKTSLRTASEIDTARRMIAAALSAAPQPSPTAQAASSAVLKAIRKANMQLVRTGDNAFMLVPYKVATVQAAESVPAGEYPAMPEPFIGVQDRPWGGHAEVIRSAIGEDGVVSCYTANQMRAYVDADRAARKQGANHD